MTSGTIHLVSSDEGLAQSVQAAVNALDGWAYGGLASVDALVLPGGESTTMSMLLERFGLLEHLRSDSEHVPGCWGLDLLLSFDET